ncbi:MAG: hypothetical protein QNL33_15645 [Akkermansiaceae bacterium]|jgi:polyhydroxybutyrate depolymerase
MKNRKLPILIACATSVSMGLNPCLQAEEERPSVEHVLDFLKEKMPKSLELLKRVRDEDGEEGYQEVVEGAGDILVEYLEIKREEGKESAERFLGEERGRVGMEVLVAAWHETDDDADEEEDGREEEDRENQEFSITQSWSQEKNFKRPYWVNVPERREAADQEPLPVIVFLHGNGGNAQGLQRMVSDRYPGIASQFITVFPQGYRESWNIVSERSKADDRGFIEAIIRELAKRDEVNKKEFTIMGISNGAALVNQIAIESQLPNIKNYIAAVSPLNGYQHNGKHFKAMGKANGYQAIAKPLFGRRLLNISGTEDLLVPYQGGPSKAIPAKGGKLPFVDAEESIFLWAKQMGYEGRKLTEPSKVNGKIEIFSYLDGDVVHFKVNDHGHNATQALSERLLLEFLRGK